MQAERLRAWACPYAPPLPEPEAVTAAPDGRVAPGARALEAVCKHGLTNLLGPGSEWDGATSGEGMI